MKLTSVKSIMAGTGDSPAIALRQHFSSSLTHAPQSLPSTKRPKLPAISRVVMRNTTKIPT
jgi:hypothetical protein